MAWLCFWSITSRSVSFLKERSACTPNYVSKVWTKSAVCPVSKWRVWQWSATASTLKVCPEGTQDRNNKCPSSYSDPLQPRQLRCSLGDSDEKHRTLDSGSWGHVRGMKSVSSDSCILPYMDSTEFLDMSSFPLVTGIFWCSHYLAFCCKNSYMSWLYPRFLGAVFQLPEVLFPRLNIPRLSTKKHNSQI